MTLQHPSRCPRQPLSQRRSSASWMMTTNGSLIQSMQESVNSKLFSSHVKFLYRHFIAYSQKISFIHTKSILILQGLRPSWERSGSERPISIAEQSFKEIEKTTQETVWLMAWSLLSRCGDSDAENMVCHRVQDFHATPATLGCFTGHLKFWGRHLKAEGVGVVPGAGAPLAWV